MVRIYRMKDRQMDLRKGELDRLLSCRGISGSKMFVIPFFPYNNNYPNSFLDNFYFSTRTHTYNRFIDIWVTELIISDPSVIADFLRFNCVITDREKICRFFHQRSTLIDLI